MLSGKKLGRPYSSREDGFSHTAFFDRLQPLDGVPSLVLGVTDTDIRFGGYTSHGFAARDDYREASTPRGLFVFAIRDGCVVIADSTDRVLYDFADYAIRIGAASLCIPMNPTKHFLAADVATSSCTMPDGNTSVFGEFTRARLRYIEVLVAQQFIDEASSRKQEKKGFFNRIFG